MNTRIYFPLPQWAVEFPRFLSKDGAFGAVRKHDIHTGVDLYTAEGAPVLAMEDGHVIAVVPFTGPPESPWWLPTLAVLIAGASGVLCYGEVVTVLREGDDVRGGEPIANVIPVLAEGKANPEIYGHSRAMLHLELYTASTRSPVWWKLNEPCPDCLKDPMPLLVRAWNERSVHGEKDC